MTIQRTAGTAAARLSAALQDEGGGTCCRCAALRPLEELLIVYDVPLASGGSDTAANVRVVCRMCGASRR